MKIHLVNYEETFNDGILTKYAKEMERGLLDLGHEVTRSHRPDPKADVNHHINYASYKKTKTIDTLMVTHITGDMGSTNDKIKGLKESLKTATGICFSQSMVDKLIDLGLPADKLAFTLPAHDSTPRRPRIIAIATNVYPDGRKREEMFTKLFERIDPLKFTFRILGKGWRETLEPLAKKGAKFQWVEEFRTDFYQELLATSDYLLYTGGEDALAQSIIDAKQASLKIIAPPQDDLEVELPFTNQEELNKIFKKLEENPVKGWTWENYCANHLKIWQQLYAKNQPEVTG